MSLLLLQKNHSLKKYYKKITT